jgi:hypothetical protein
VGVPLQKLTGELEVLKSYLLLSLGRHSKQAGDERNLPQDVPFFDTAHLSFPHHVHHLISMSRVPCGLKGKEAQPWFDASLTRGWDEAVILFDNAVQELDQDVSSTALGRIPAEL